MEGRWNAIGIHLLCFLVFIVGVEIHGSSDEGFILLRFRAEVKSDPHGVLANWNLSGSEPCTWFGVHCIAGKVHILNLSGCSLEGTLSPEIGKLTQLRSLLLRDNSFSGIIPKQIGRLKKLEILDVRNNELNGTIPTEIGKLRSLKGLWVSGNKLEGPIPGEMRRLKLLSPLKLDYQTLAYASTNGIWRMKLKQLRMAYPQNIISIIPSSLADYLNKLMPQMFYLRDASPQPSKGNCCCCYEHGATDQNLVQNVEIFVKFARRKLQESQPEIISNLVAENASILLPSSQGIFNIVPIITRGSGAFPAIPNSSHLAPPSSSPTDNDMLRGDTDSVSSDDKKGPITHDNAPWDIWSYFLVTVMVVALLAAILVLLMVCRRRRRRGGVESVGLTRQLQRALTSGVPKLNRSELETACEDFSNIIQSYDGATMYKGTLTSGVEIAVISTTIASRKEWSKNAEKAYRKKIDTLSRINHKNFVNLIGFCEEDEPYFNRMMVLEYAPNGTLFEHIHVEGMEHLDWSSRVRIIMGVAYCLEYMHHEITPHVSHSDLNSHSIYLTDDYAAKIGEVSFMSQAASQAKPRSENGSEHSEPSILSAVDPQMNVYSFGLLLLEIISGKLPNSQKDGPIEKWAAEYFSQRDKLGEMADKSLKAFKSNELEVICEVAQECIIPDPKQRPSMQQIVPRLREVINIKPEQAVPRLSPLWWAELEIMEAS